MIAATRNRCIPRSQTLGPRRALLVTLAAVSLLAACDDPNEPGANFSIYTVDSQTVYAINGTPANAPNAVNFFGGIIGNSAVRANSAFAFDLAFDITDDGKVAIIPVRKIASELLQPHLVGMQLVENTHYDSLKIAPKEGYKNDSTFVVGVGALLAVRTEEPSCLQQFLNEAAIYGKLLVLKIDTGARTIQLKYTADPNCGFRSLTTGVPTE
jgi:hypothetical protein